MNKPPAPSSLRGGLGMGLKRVPAPFTPPWCSARTTARRSVATGDRAGLLPPRRGEGTGRIKPRWYAAVFVCQQLHDLGRPRLAQRRRVAADLRSARVAQRSNFANKLLKLGHPILYISSHKLTVLWQFVSCINALEPASALGAHAAPLSRSRPKDRVARRA
jgi:hypothetical protein